MSIHHNLPPVARGVLCIDFDGTIFPWGDLEEDVPPLPGAAESVRSFKEAGFRIVIFTSRMSPTWWSSEGWNVNSAVGERWWDSVASRLNKWGIPFDSITCEKVPAAAYIDDKAIEFRDNWRQIRERILG